MSKNDEPLVIPQDLLVAVALLTRIPVPATGADRGAKAAWAYPLVGLLVGAMAALAGAISYGAGLPAPLTALIVLAFLVIPTGAMHEDGLADTADGLWGGWTREKRLEIMRDSRIGTYGVIAIFLGLSARWGAIWLLFETGPGFAFAAILTAAALSRAAMPALMALLPHARASGLSHSVGAVSAATALLAAAIAFVAALILTGAGGFVASVCTVVTAACIVVVARKKIGGQTGDILGATQQIAEIAVLFSLLA